MPLTPDLKLPESGTARTRPVQFLALCGSLRQQSRSRTLLHAMTLRLPPWATLCLHDSLGSLPLFNPDDEAAPSEPVLRLWNAVEQAEALIIASPEYAHGVTGTIKNALDWLVGFPPFAGKPVAVLNPSHRADHADLALKEILRTMAARLVDGASLRIPVTACELDASQLAMTTPYCGLIDGVFEALQSAVAEEAVLQTVDPNTLACNGQQHPQPPVAEEYL